MIAVLALLVMALVLSPTVYVRWAMGRHAADRPDLPGTGGELARHLLDEAGLHHVAVEPTDEGDHYDPAAPAVRLAPEHLDGRSITAVAVAAHEVAHAVQHAQGSRLFGLRMALMRVVAPLEVDASFGRALPALTRGGYLRGPDLAAARAVLRAAAMTYVAGAFLSLLNLARVVR